MAGQGVSCPRDMPQTVHGDGQGGMCRGRAGAGVNPLVRTIGGCRAIHLDRSGGGVPQERRRTGFTETQKCALHSLYHMGTAVKISITKVNFSQWCHLTFVQQDRTLRVLELRFELHRKKGPQDATPCAKNRRVELGLGLRLCDL